MAGKLSRVAGELSRVVGEKLIITVRSSDLLLNYFHLLVECGIGEIGAKIELCSLCRRVVWETRGFLRSWSCYLKLFGEKNVMDNTIFVAHDITRRCKMGWDQCTLTTVLSYVSKSCRRT